MHLTTRDLEGPAGNVGILLADAAYHVADALAESTPTPRPVIMAKITKALLFELSKPTDEHTGDFVPRP